jgi:hypothetical protein
MRRHCRFETHHLLQGQTKTGKLKYPFSKKTGPNTVDVIPDGYELFENSVDAIIRHRLQL